MPAKKQSQLYIVLQPIRYHNPSHPLGGQVVKPGDDAAKAGLPMDHLEKDNPVALKVLLRKKVLAPKPEPKTK